MATASDLLDKALDVGLDVGANYLKPKVKTPAAPTAPAQSKIPTWLLPVGIVAGIAVVLLLVFRNPPEP